MRLQHINKLDYWIEHLLSWIVLAILIVYTYALFVRIPYAGFLIDGSDGAVEKVFVTAKPGADLRLGDVVIKVGSVAVAEYQSHITVPLISKVQAGQVLPIILQRGGETRLIPWVVPGPNPDEIRFRLVNVYLLAYVFWFCGLAVKYSVRPIDIQWRLLIILFFLTAIWLMTGSVSSFTVLMSPIVFRSAIWLTVPVCLHLHWVMPKPLVKAPGVSLWVLYGVFIALAAAEWFLLLPRNAYLFGITVLVLGAVIILGLRYFLHPQQRWELNILGLGLLLTVIPTLTVSLIGIFADYPNKGEFSLFSVLALPVAYFYVISRKKLGDLEMRINRAISGYVFLILLGMILLVLLPLVEGYFQTDVYPLFFSLLVALLSGLFAVVAFPRFERWMDRRIFGIKLIPERLIEEYSSSIATSFDVSSIICHLRDEFLPSLLIRQSVLFRLHGTNSAKLVYERGIEIADLPGVAQIETLCENTGRYLPPGNTQCPPDFSWVRLILAMQAGGERVGLWLLGQKDPDDYYAQAEIPVLQTIANHTAGVLVNADQAAQLRALYQANIERYEDERLELASDLHDEVLNQMAVLSMTMGDRHSPEVEDRFMKVNDYIRRIISDLRPVMLTYGLLPGLEEMVDEISDRSGNAITVRLEIADSQLRYDNKVESHLYRIIQQAVENAIRYSKGKEVRIQGEFKPHSVYLVVEDDGVGFPDSQQLNFQRFLERRHFGLARMFERAAIIGADLQIHSVPGRGTKISLEWPAGGTTAPLRV